MKIGSLFYITTFVNVLFIFTWYHLRGRQNGKEVEICMN